MSPDTHRDGMPPGSDPASARSARGGQSEGPGARDLLGTVGRKEPPGSRERILVWVHRRGTVLVAAGAALATALVVLAIVNGWWPRLLVACLVPAAAGAALGWVRRRNGNRETARALAERQGRHAEPSLSAPEEQSSMRTQAAVTEAVPTAPTAEPTAGEPNAAVLELRRIATRGRLSKRAALTAAAAVCRDVDNPGARALRAGAELARLDLPAVTALRLHPDGASAVIKDTEVVVGRPNLFGSVDDELLDGLGDESGRTVVVGWDGEARAAFLLVPAS